jgi:hypothetical protein
VPDIVVRPAGDRAFQVEVAMEDERHAYRVSVPSDLAGRLDADPAEVARATLAFLLDREPPSSILGSFDCSVVPRYFPEYEAKLPAYLAG